MTTENIFNNQLTFHIMGNSSNKKTGFWGRIRNFMYEYSDEGLLEKAKEAFKAEDIKTLEEILEIRDYDRKDPVVINILAMQDQLMDKWRQQIIEKYLPNLKIIEDDFNGEKYYTYAHLHHPDDSTLVSLYLTDSKSVFRMCDCHLKISYNGEGGNLKKVVFSHINNGKRDAYTIAAYPDGQGWVHCLWETEDYRSGNNYTVLDIPIAEREMSHFSSIQSKYECMEKFILYFKAASSKNDWKIRFTNTQQVDILTRQLSQAEIDGLTCILNMYQESQIAMNRRTGKDYPTITKHRVWNNIDGFSQKTSDETQL